MHTKFALAAILSFLLLSTEERALEDDLELVLLPSLTEELLDVDAVGVELVDVGENLYTVLKEGKAQSSLMAACETRQAEMKGSACVA